MDALDTATSLDGEIAATGRLEQITEELTNVHIAPAHTNCSPGGIWRVLPEHAGTPQEVEPATDTRVSVTG